MIYPGFALDLYVLALCIDAVGVFYIPSRLWLRKYKVAVIIFRDINYFTSINLRKSATYIWWYAPKIFADHCYDYLLFVCYASLGITPFYRLSRSTSLKKSWHRTYTLLMGEGFSGLLVNAIHCRIVVSESELQRRYYVHFRTNTIGKGMIPLIFPAMVLILPHLFFSKHGFGIKWTTKFDLPLNHKTEPINEISINKSISFKIFIQ